MLRHLCLVLLLVLLGLGPAQAEEIISDFSARISVNGDGSVNVIEKLRVYAEGNKIRHGIYRDLYTLVPGWSGLLRGKLEVLSVERDGQTEDWHMGDVSENISLSGSSRIYIGSKDTTVSEGWHTYTLAYRLGHQVRFFSTYDELYWNVTGNEWSFPIQRAEATVTLPPGAHPVQMAAYAGESGSKGTEGTDYQLEQGKTGQIVVHSLQTLSPGDGLTIAVGWQKGIVPEPTPKEWLQIILADNPSLPAGLGLFALLFIYYLLAWHWVGRDPRQGPVVPVYAPRHAPAAMRYVRRMGFDRKTFVAALISLASKGYLAIEERDATGGKMDPAAEAGMMSAVMRWLPKTWAVVKTTDGGQGASVEEEFLYLRLFADGAYDVALTRSNRTALVKLLKEFEDHLDSRFNGSFFRRNTGWFAFGLVLSLASWAAVSLAQGGAALGLGLFMCVWLGIWSLGTGLLLSGVFSAWKKVFSGHVWKLIPALFVSLFSLPFVAGWVFGAFMLAVGVGAAATAFLILVTILNVVFFRLLRAPTQEGRTLLDEAEGTSLYLTVAEADRIRFATPPDTPETFGKFLPYAIALDLETEWSQRFANRFQSVTTQESHGHSSCSPSWYRGSHAFDTATLSSLSGSLVSAVSAATASNSSGSGGGGSSGGGGGGGGGGGW